MKRILGRLISKLLHAAFWIATLFVLVCLLGSLRWLRPGHNPTSTDFAAFGAAVLCALGLFTIFYVYDTFWRPPEGEEWEAQGMRVGTGAHPSQGDRASRNAEVESVERAMGIEPTS
jgi:hypothetical protein